MQEILLSLSSLIAVIGPITYIISILRGISKPQRMTRFILFFVMTLNFISIISANGNLGAKVFAGIVCFQAIIIFVLSLWRGMGGANRFDYFCLVIAALGLVIWKLTGNPVMGIIFSIIADFFAYLPAFVKTWHHPETESVWYYILTALSAFLGVMAYKIEVSSLFQIYILLSCLVMVGFIYRESIGLRIKKDSH